MTDLLLNSSGDLDIQNGDLVLIPTYQQLIRQQILITLKTFRGEWGYNIEFGVPYVSNDNNPIQILGKTKKSIFDMHIREAIKSVNGVLSLTAYNSTLDYPSQVMTISFTAAISGGTIQDNIVVNI